MNKGLEISMPFFSYGQHCNHVKNQSEHKKRGATLLSFDPAAFKMGANAGRASPVSSEQPLMSSRGYFNSECNFTSWARARHQTFILLPVRETQQAWRAIKCLHCKAFYLQVQLEEQPVGFQKDVFGHGTRER